MFDMFFEGCPPPPHHSLIPLCFYRFFTAISKMLKGSGVFFITPFKRASTVYKARGKALWNSNPSEYLHFVRDINHPGNFTHHENPHRLIHLCSTYVQRDHIYNNNLYFSSKESMPQCSGLHRVCCIRNLFYSLRSEFKRICILFALYSHVSVYSPTPFIRIIRFIFASKYSHKFEYKKSICCKTNKFSHTGEYLLQNIRFDANYRKNK
jgi:hypothetical protein